MTIFDEKSPSLLSASGDADARRRNYLRARNIFAAREEKFFAAQVRAIFFTPNVERLT